MNQKQWSYMSPTDSTVTVLMTKESLCQNSDRGITYQQSAEQGPSGDQAWISLGPVTAQLASLDGCYYIYGGRHFLIE